MKGVLAYLAVVAVLWVSLMVVAWRSPSLGVGVALISLASTITGAVLAAGGQFVQFYLTEKARSKADDSRKKVLLQMLDCDGWRELSTLSHVIGADEELTKRLLLETGARASENGNPVWALIKRKPLPKYKPPDVTADGSN